ncbi:MAG TPA: hypothetical protein VL947_13040, partial [Cytophagales bacterium]|nr:hypothetical protein [Cytophagales bacterium]
NCKILYDIQENYSLNISTGTLKPSWLRRLLATYVRIKQQALAPFVDHFILAEHCYAEELPFVSKRYTTWENKVDVGVITYQKPKPAGKLMICITGTLGATYGTIEAIRCAKELMHLDPSISLKVIGYCADDQYLKQVIQEIGSTHNITFEGGSTLVPHGRILEVIAESHFSFMFYQTNESFKNKIPTKFYECIALNTQTIASSNSKWQAFLQRYNGGLCIDIQHIDMDQLLQLLYLRRGMPCKAGNDIFFDIKKQNVLKLIK